MSFGRFQLRRDTAANWTAANPVLAEGELAINLTNSTFKVGDGTTAWNSLPIGGAASNAVINDAIDDNPSATRTALGFDEAVDDRVSDLLVAGDNITLTYDDGAGTLTIDSSGGGGGSAVPVPMRQTSGQLYFPPMGAGIAHGTPANFYQSVTFVPFNIGITIDALAFEVTTAAAGNALVGIYERDATGRPGALVRSASAVSLSTTGVKVAVLGSTYTVTSPVYLAIVTSINSALLRTFAAGPQVLGVSNFSDIPNFGTLRAFSLGGTSLPADATVPAITVWTDMPKLLARSA